MFVCKYLKSYEATYILKHFKKELWTFFLYYVYIFILIFYTNYIFLDVGKYRDVTIYITLLKLLIKILKHYYYYYYYYYIKD